jgi:hypothetical protein
MSKWQRPDVVVFFNGVHVIKEGEHTNAKPGRALWDAGKTQ